MKDKLIAAANATPDDVLAAVMVTKHADGKIRVFSPGGASVSLGLLGSATAIIASKLGANKEQADG